MSLLQTLSRYFGNSRHPESDPAEAYDIWSQSYDDQSDNLMLALDRSLCRELMAGFPVAGKTIVDIGCGTGRHWPDLLARSPARLLGYDVSGGMLNRLRLKYPSAETFLISGSTLTGLGDASCDLVLSTLTVAHLPDPEEALAEWRRVLRPGGRMIITDYHPAALARGGQRTFREGNRLIAVRNHVYPVDRILKLAGQLGLKQVNVIERKVDESMRPWYERRNALQVFQRFLGVPIIYGLHLIQTDAAQ